jgi:hypothetical protein
MATEKQSFVVDSDSRSSLVERVMAMLSLDRLGKLIMRATAFSWSL